MKEKELKNEGLADLAYKAEADHEVQMARAELYKIGKYAIKLHEMLKGVSEQDGLEGWVQSKITKAGDYLSSVYHHMDYEQKFEQVQTEAKAKPIIGEENNTARLKRELDYDPDKVRSFINNLAKKQKTSALSDKEKQDFADAQELLADLTADLDEAKAKPDFLDMDKDGNKKEPMKKAIKDKEKEKKAKKETVETVGAILYKAEDELINEDLGAALNHLTSAAKEIAKTLGGGAIDAVAGGAGAAAGLPDRIKNKFSKAKSGMQRSSVDYASDLQNKLESKLSEKSSKETTCPDCNKPSYKTLPEEKQKGVDGKVCWKGYKRMGTKKKGGKTVDNCVKM